MKVLLINKFLYPKGGAPISTLTTGSLLSKKGHEVFFWGMEHPDNPEYPHSDLFVDYADLVDGGSICKKARTSFNVLYSLQAKQRIKQFIEIERPDIVHLNNFAHQISPSILHVFKKYNIPSVMTMRDYKLVCPAYTMLSNGKVCEKCKDGKYYNCLFNKCTHNSLAKSLVNTIEMYFHHKILKIYDLIDVFISPSAFLKDKVKEMGFDREIEYLPNFVDFADFQPKYESGQKSIVYFGRLSSEKGLSTLLDAVKELDIQLMIIGDGPIKHQLQAKAADDNINNVSFLGYKSGDELQGIIKNAIATITPSEWYENNPRTVIESFALGKPVLGARIGGIPELVKDGKTGYTFESGSVNDLRSKINLLIEDPNEAIKMGQAARKHVETEFCSERHYIGLTNIYERAITIRSAQK